ncbi:MAG: hypothetical protein F6K26_36500 [Moorea sp. SIO2I5]|nr:hypothetical protein [Moorena sp. SIO2I5]
MRYGAMLLAKYKLTSKTLILPLIALQNYKMFFDHYTEYQGFKRVKKCFASSIRGGLSQPGR